MAFIFKVKLKGSSKPPIWRKIEMNESDNFWNLHLSIQGAFGWANCHLFQFAPAGYGSHPTITIEVDGAWPEEPLQQAGDWPDEGYFDAVDILLHQYFGSYHSKMTYIYDFGDDWIHTIELVDRNDKIIMHPRCTAGKGNTPPEDCGGIHGYYHLVEIINDPRDPDHKNYRHWMQLKKGAIWDLHQFDRDEANDRMRRV